MEIREMESAAWADFVSTGHKHDQLAHRVVGPMGHTSAPMFDLTQYAKGARNNWSMVDDAGFNSFLPRTLAATEFEDLRKIMRAANEYVARQHFRYVLQRIMPIHCAALGKGVQCAIRLGVGARWRPGYVEFFIWGDSDR